MLRDNVFAYPNYALEINNAALDKLLYDFEKSVDRLNDAMKIYGMPVCFDCTMAVDKFRRGPDITKARLASIFDGKFKGVLEPEHILTITSATFNYLDCKHDLLMWGTYQVGKTISFTTLFCLLPIIEKLINKSLVIPVINNFSSNNVKNQTVKELNVMLLLYGDVLVSCKDEVVKFNYVQEDIRDSLFADSPRTGWDKLVLNRNPAGMAKNDDLITTTKEKFPNTNFKFLKYCDEVQIGSAKKSVHQAMHKQYSHDGEVRSIYLTATVGEMVAARQSRLTPVWVGTQYCGPIHYNGVKLPTIDPNHKKDIKYSKLSSLLGTDDYAYFYENRSCFGDFEVYKSVFNSEIKNWHRFKRQFAEMVYELFVSLASNNSPVVFLRPFDRVAPCKELIAILEEVIEECGQSGNYEVLDYTGNLDAEMFVDGRTIKEVLIDNYIKLNKRCLVVCSSGRAKAGDSFPYQCGFYVFFNDSIANWDGYAQILYRAAGNRKNSEVFIPDAIFNHVLGAVSNGWRSTFRQPNRRTTWADGLRPQKKRGAKACQIVINMPA